MYGTALGQYVKRNNNCIAVNLNSLMEKSQREFFIRFLQKKNNSVLIQQRQQEFLDMYYGRPVDLQCATGQNIFSQFNYII